MEYEIVGCKYCEYRKTRFIKSSRAWIQGGYFDSRCKKSKKDKYGNYLKVRDDMKKPHRNCPLKKEKANKCIERIGEEK